VKTAQSLDRRDVGAPNPVTDDDPETGPEAMPGIPTEGEPPNAG